MKGQTKRIPLLTLCPMLTKPKKCFPSLLQRTMKYTKRLLQRFKQTKMLKVPLLTSCRPKCRWRMSANPSKLLPSPPNQLLLQQSRLFNSNCSLVRSRHHPWQILAFLLQRWLCLAGAMTCPLQTQTSLPMPAPKLCKVFYFPHPSCQLLRPSFSQILLTLQNLLPPHLPQLPLPPPFSTPLLVAPQTQLIKKPLKTNGKLRSLMRCPISGASPVALDLCSLSHKTKLPLLQAISALK
mmetsp:Transcript_26062/g.51388  ORF Transcript_26062/g.51388 Transcript_26062/m.51388 type:complete len:238 (+) Transcript_26062:362-1075(+)